MSLGKGIIRIARSAGAARGSRGMGFGGRRGGRGGRGDGPGGRGRSRGSRGRIGGDGDDWREGVLEEQIPEAAWIGFHAALDSVGNAGQLSIIEDLGESGFEEGAHYTALTGNDCLDVLVSLTSHPEAVMGPLTDGADAILQYMQEVASSPQDFM